MKITRYDLVHAKDKQLRAVCITRKGNSGWLKAALAREFSEQEVARFHAEKCSTQEALFRAASEKERADRIGLVSQWLMEQIDLIHAALCYGQNGTWQQRTEQVVTAVQKLRPELFHKDSAGDFANRLFAEHREEFDPPAPGKRGG